MHRLKLLLCALLIALAAGCSSGPSSNQPKYVGGNGLTFNSPVIIVGAKSLAAGFAAEKAWLAQHFPDAKITNQQFLPIADRRFDLFDLTTADGQTVHVYFDITDFLDKPPQ